LTRLLLSGVLIVALSACGAKGDLFLVKESSSTTNEEQGKSEKDKTIEQHKKVNVPAKPEIHPQEDELEQPAL